MPTLEEAESLFDETTSIRDCDRFEIFIDPTFSLVADILCGP